MPYKNKADKRAHNQAVSQSSEGQQRAAHRKGLERYRYDKALAYWRFRLVYGKVLPDLILGVSHEMVQRACDEVRDSRDLSVEWVELLKDKQEKCNA